ncbi:hypothetical protein IQ247_30385 [Plectonema cf. radiosum LEGE 06105]|uniref:Uncharacterized protein n=1 Tax=Plectonema cf. radiosum LEGE 06105 TaxID=945769 RepID=A0A8J7FG74_9CYAN|nr:hypothetical protein [Plectonema radiosum]MBE9216909.1 hypothetical protein [Plectonema cf. radiosum LEGE 06105]
MMIMTALNAYYMALALYSEGNHSRETLELIFLDSVKAIARRATLCVSPITYNT